MTKHRPVFALVDCNNFFVSCERVFRPDLAERPVAVLSNNDGCIVARSNEVKVLGVPMGAPEFKWRSLLKQHDVVLFSANFNLYGDFSRRVVEVLETYTPDIEVYSVDESFLEAGSLLINNYEKWASALRDDVWRRLGIPVSVGVAESKTLAKAAAELAKQQKSKSGGAVNLTGLSLAERNRMLSKLPVEDVWGVGRRYASKLRGFGIRTAADLAAVTPKWARQQLTIRGERMVRELRGESCFPLSDTTIDDGQKTLAVTRSFGRNVHAMFELEPAVASFASRAAARLRRHKQIASGLVVFIRSGVNARRPANFSAYVSLPYPTSDTSQIVTAALAALSDAYTESFQYRKAGVILLGLKPDSAQQTTFEQSGRQTYLEGRDRLMAALDAVNKRYGTNTLVTAAAGTPKARGKWASRQERRSPDYVTNWAQLPVIR